MKKTARSVVSMLLAIALVTVWSASLQRSQTRAADPPYGIKKRIPWQTSRITGSPDPPPPYRIERVFPKLTFNNPLLLTSAPGTERLFIGEQAGKLYSFPNDQACTHADLFLDLTKEVHSWDKAGNVKGVEAVYGLTFHPNFARNRYCYVCYVLNSKKGGEQLADGTRVSRFRVSDTDPPRCDPQSEKVLITWLAGGHNGGCLAFGPDGYLYISTGDGADPNPPDKLDTGQDLSDLLSSILRIDVDHEDKDKPYAIPADNPFLKTPGARPEIWAYGFRNPWKMSFDHAKGDLWVGDVGWELWEMIYRVQRGGNYGWSIMEGRQPVRAEGKRGPTPILPPALDFPHSEAASITGGYVYHGKRLTDLAGAYVCGDWMTGKLWGTRFDGDRIVSHRELARAPMRIVAFGEDHAGELYFVHYDEKGSIHQLVPNAAAQEWTPSFPQKLSDTGLFASVRTHAPAPGVVPFSVNVPQWLDHATAERWVALPADSTVRLYDAPIRVPGTAWFNAAAFFPKDGVLTRTLSMEMTCGNPASVRHLETQVLHFDGSDWRGYTYQWNDEQTDATLVPGAGAERTLTITDRHALGGKRVQKWHFPSRAECLQCHNPWTGFNLGFTRPQLDKVHAYGTQADQQLRALEHIGVIALTQNDESRARRREDMQLERLFDPYGTAGSSGAARSYLHVNCSHCHRFGAGGTALLDLRAEIPLEKSNTLEVRPNQGTFEIAGAQILAPGDPYRSVLFYRISKLGPGRMPHIGSDVVDERGVRLIHDWIQQLPIRKDERVLLDKLQALDEQAILAREHAEVAEQLERTARTLAEAAGRKEANAEDRQKAERQLKEQAESRVKQRTDERTETIQRLLSSTSGALLLAQALADEQVPNSVRPQVLAVAVARPEPQVRDLFERFLPDEQRVKRLGSVIKPEQILSLKGNAARGKELFFKTAGVECSKCHRIGDTGATLGPDLSQIARKLNRAQILESILEPSKTIDPPYVTYLVETKEGQVLTGLLASKTEAEVVLKVIGDKEIHIPAGKVATVVPLRNSLMPDLLLRDMTAEQVADLLEFLAGLK